MRAAATLALGLAALVAATDLAAQRQQAPREVYRREREPDAPPTAATRLQDPFEALERELPSLRVDLRITPDQAPSWSRFEREVRDLAELDRARRRDLIALREPAEKPLPAAKLVQSLAEHDRKRAEASGRLVHNFEALYALLDARQQAMLDRRILMSQTQPLGTREAPPAR